jgi:hypothetical protein
MDWMTKRVPFWAAVAVAWIAIADIADAATFRITSKIYAGAALDPSAEHRILFDEGLVYDFPQIETRFVTVYDEAQNRVTMLDRETQVQTILGAGDLEKITAQVRAAAVTPQQQGRLGLLSQVEPSKRVIGYTIKFGNLEYHTSTQTPDDPTIAIDYARFVILASRLNIVRHRGAPPFGRMTLNNHIAMMGELPLETTLTVRHGEKFDDYRSTHELDELTPLDRKRIDEVRGMLTLYREVELKQFP